MFFQFLVYPIPSNPGYDIRIDKKAVLEQYFVRAPAQPGPTIFTFEEDG